MACSPARTAQGGEGSSRGAATSWRGDVRSCRGFEVDKEYRFETDEGIASLADLFRGRSQLLVYHFMFGPDYKAGCPSCSAIADGYNGIAVHLANHDVMLWTVSRAPLAKLQAYKRRMGWTFPWASSFGSDFNVDFNVLFTEDQQREGLEYNYQREAPLQLRDNERSEIPSRSTPDGPAKAAAMAGTDVATYTRERPGMSAFRCSRAASSTTPIPAMRAAWTASGARISGSTAPPRAQRDRLLVAPPRRIRVASSKRRLVLPRAGGAWVNAHQ